MPDFMRKLRGRKPAPRLTDEAVDLEQFFTDAEHACQVFEQLVSAAHPPKRLLVIHGVGGVGKSTLLKMYRLSCRRRRIPVALVGGEEAPSPADVLADWAADLSGDDVKLSTFQARLTHYHALQAKVETEAKKASQAVEKLGKAVAKTAVEMAASAIPVMGPLASVLGGAGTEAFVDWLRGFLSKPDLELYLDPTQRLTDDFVTDLARAAARQRLVMMADTYEQMTTLGDWLRDLARRLPESVLLVIAGRAMPEWDRAWPGWMGQAEIVELKEMTPDDLRTLVRRYYAHIRGGEPDPQQVEAVVQFARGLPMAATTVVQLWVRHGVEDFQAVRPQVVADLVDRLLEGVPPKMQPAFEAAAALRYFNADSLRALLDGGDVDTLYAELRRWPFIRPRREGLAVHDTMREMMNEALRVRTPERFRVLHERAAGYYEAQITGMKVERRDQMTLELLYHRLRTDESEGVALLERLFKEAAQLWRQEQKIKLLDEASQYRFKERHHRYRLQHLKAQVTSDWKEREALYKTLVSEDLDDAMRAAVLRDLAEPLFFQGKKDEARRYLQEALGICERLGNPIETAWTLLILSQSGYPEETYEYIDRAIGAFREAKDEHGLALAELQLGWYYLNRWQAIDARDAFSRSLALREKLGHRRAAAMVRERIGQTYLIEGDFQYAIAFKEEALEVFEELQDEWSIAWTLDELATCYGWVGRWEPTLSLLERARAIFADWNDTRETACAMRQAGIYREQGRLELASETYQRALGTMPEHGSWSGYGIYAGMGNIHLDRGEFEDALADYQKAIAVFREHGMELEARMTGGGNLGRLYFAQGCWTNAIENYIDSLEAVRSANNYLHECLALVGICQANYKQGNLDQLDDMVGRIEELGQAYQYYQLLADINILQGHIALDRSHVDREQLVAAVRFYSASLEESLFYNRYKLDETIQAVIAHCHERGDEGNEVLIALHVFWRTGHTGTNDSYKPCPEITWLIPKGIPLLEAERIAREREPGDGSLQRTVVEQIEKVLESGGNR